MTYQLLFNALQTAINVHDKHADPDTYGQLVAAKAELKDLIDRDNVNDIWHGECYVMPAQSVCDYLDSVTYDIYGRLYVSSEDNAVSLLDYKEAVRKDYDYARLSDAALELGYDTVCDLYADNEQFGCHNPDGTFNYSAN